MARSVEKAAVSTPGVINRDWMTAGTNSALVTPNSGITSRMRAGSTSRRTTVWHPWNKPTIDHPDPAMWNIGITAMFTESLSNFHDSVTFITPEKKLALVSITPLGRPVVPDV